MKTFHDFYIFVITHATPSTVEIIGQINIIISTVVDGDDFITPVKRVIIDNNDFII
jgi:Na+-transporting NADH:ubiquinone oxidoreductase subunit NqrD